MKGHGLCEVRVRSLSKQRSGAVRPAQGIWLTWQPCELGHFPHFTVQGVDSLSGKLTYPEVAMKWLSQLWNPATVTLDSIVCHWVKWHSESEILDELMAYPLYTFQMNRPLGLIKREKRLIVSPNSCKLFTLHLCWWLIKERRCAGTTQGSCNSSRVCNEEPVWMPACMHRGACCSIRTCSGQSHSLPWAWSIPQKWLSGTKTWEEQAYVPIPLNCLLVSSWLLWNG